MSKDIISVARKGGNISYKDKHNQIHKGDKVKEYNIQDKEIHIESLVELDRIQTIEFIVQKLNSIDEDKIKCVLQFVIHIAR